MSLRARKNEMRRDLHREAAIPALYIVPGAPEPLSVDVRVHRSVVTPGDDSMPEGAVVRRDIAPRILFLREQVSLPVRNAVVSVAAGEAYHLGETQLPDGITVTAMVTQMTQAQIDKRFPAGQPIPEAP